MNTALPPILPPIPANLGRGVDLNIVKNRRLHGHRYVMLARFVVPEKTMAGIAEKQLKIQADAVAGREPTAENVEIPMTPENLIGLEGPGCCKCGLHWMAPGGYGELCMVSDEVLGVGPEPQHVGEPAPPAGDTSAFEDAKSRHPSTSGHSDHPVLSLVK